MGENTRKDRRTKVLSMTVRYRSATLGEFIEHHSYDVSRGGMFIKTPSPFPPGTLLKFEVKIAEDQRVMQGVGRVVWKRDLDGNTPDDPAGMGIKFIKIDDASRAVIDKLVEGRPAGQEGAFEHLPDAKPRMFPSTPAQAAPEDPTVMKPAAELLKDALRKSGEAEDIEAPGPEALLARGKETPAEDGGKETSKKELPKASQTSETRARDSQVRSSTERKEDEEGRGRALVSILVALVVAVAIYFVTKQGSKPVPPRTERVQEQAHEPSPTPEVYPPAHSADPVVEPLGSSVPFELPPVPAIEQAPLAPAASAPAPIAEPAPKSEITPKPVPKPRPTPRPAAPKGTPKPADSVLPPTLGAAEPSSPPTPAAAPEVTPLPASTDAPVSTP